MRWEYTQNGYTFIFYTVLQVVQMNERKNEMKMYYYFFVLFKHEYFRCHMRLKF